MLRQEDMKPFKLNLDDLQPQEVTFQLSDKPGKTYTLKKFSLATRVWLFQKFGKENIQGIFDNQSLPEISEIAHYLLKDKTDFPSVESFQESFVTQADFVTLIQSLLKTVGLSEPVIQKIAKELDLGEALSPNHPIGASTTTSSPASTDTP